MSLWLYNLLTGAYFLGIRLAAFFSGKANSWVQGRRGIFKKMDMALQNRDKNRPLLWMHCASLGEFEQGRTVLESLRNEMPGLQVFLTFFSPSGYEIRKNYQGADWVFYLPSDTARHASAFLQLLQPSLAVFVKYEFWYHYLSALKQRQIPAYLIAAIFREKHPFFQWYGTLHRRMLACFSKLYVQDEESLKLVATVTVAEIAQMPADLPWLEKFCGGSPVLVCGSTWPDDEKVIHQFAQAPEFGIWKIILAPHDIQAAHLQAIERQFQGSIFRYSQLEKQAGQGSGAARILLIDNIGMLSKLYRYAKVAYIGGGFGSGIHNTLEAIAYCVPVIFGPAHGKFAEAIWLKENGGGFPIQNAEGFLEAMRYLQLGEQAKASGKTAFQYIQTNQGATQTIARELLAVLGRASQKTGG
jgi:3-deoxy-D-manno-octulosonic-acid transferase